MGRVVQWKMQKLIKSFCSWDLETWPHESLPLRDACRCRTNGDASTKLRCASGLVPHVELNAYIQHHQTDDTSIFS